MGIFCSIWGCKDEPADFWGDNAEYVLYRCGRCKNETIFCTKELKLLKNDESGRKLMLFMMSNSEFSGECTMHSEFVKAETDNPFSFSKQEKQQQALRKKYGLADGTRPADPTILWEKGLWKPKPAKDGEKPAAAKPKTSKGKGKGRLIRLKDAESPPREDSDNLFGDKIEKGNPDLDVRYVPPAGSGGNSTPLSYEWNVNESQKSKNPPSGFRPDMTPEAQLKRLQRRLDKHVLREEYEKAAKIRDQIEKMKRENQ